MSKTIKVTKITTEGDTIKYEIIDNTGLNLLKNAKTNAWVKYHHAEAFGFSLENLPESILVLPITLYLMPVTWFYGIDLVVPSIDKQLNEVLPNIYATYSKIYGPFDESWRGKVLARTIVENEMLENRFDKIVFFSGGVDAVHAGIDNPGQRSVLVTVPSIESMSEDNKKSNGTNFLQSKTRLIREFSKISGSDWLMVTNNFKSDIFDDKRIQNELKRHFRLNSDAFHFDGWFGIKYFGNLLSSAPFAYAMGIKSLVVGSGFEQLEDYKTSNMDGANPELSDSFKFASMSFAKQDGLHTRRSVKVKNIIEWCVKRGKYVSLWTCFNDNTKQCGICTKCLRTQLNILLAGQDPAQWGFENFKEKVFSQLIRKYGYCERNMYMLWDIVDSIDDSRTYPYCNELLHWLKRIGYRKYFRRAKFATKAVRIFKVHRYPHYFKVLLTGLFRK